MRALSINALSELTGIMPGTIRAWESRYKALSPTRDKRNNRRIYTYADVEKLRAIKELLQHGLNIGRIAKLPKHELLSLLQELRPTPPPTETKNRQNNTPETVNKCIELLEKYKLNELNQKISEIRLSHSLESLIELFITPFFLKVGQLVEVNKLTIAQEHSFSAILRNHLIDILSTIPEVDKSSATVALATPEGNYHEFGILISNIICRKNQLNTFYFGVNMPAKALIEAVNSLNIDILILGNTPVPKEFLSDETHEFLKTINKKTKKKLKILVGGGNPIKIKLKKLDICYCTDLASLSSKLKRI